MSHRDVTPRGLGAVIDVAPSASIVRQTSIGLVRVGGWMLAAGIVSVTLMPIELRPSITADPDLERFLVFAGLGSAMGVGSERTGDGCSPALWRSPAPWRRRNA